MSTLAFIQIFLLTLSAGNSCLTSSEDYATEVVVPNYNYDEIYDVAGKTADYFLKESAYSKDLLSIIQLSENPSGLSIRIQVPTELKEISKPRIKILSDSASGTVKDVGGIVNGWIAQCDQNYCTFEKDLITIAASKNDPQVSIEINKALDSCDSQCSGICFQATTEAKCIDYKTKTDLDIILKYANLSSNLRELLNSYKIAGSEDIILQDITPIVEDNINFQEAMKQELVYLSNNRVISLAKDDIESITLLAKQGRAGTNYRIVYNSQQGEWVYYNSLPNAALSTVKDCKPYNSPSESPSIVNSISNPFYLVPTIITLASIIALLILIIVARVVVGMKPGEKV